MKTFLTSGLFKTALAVTLTMAGANQATAQGSKNPQRSIQNFATLFNPQSNSLSKVNALVSRPGNSQDFTLAGPGVWQLQTHSTYTYDAQGRLLQRLYTDPGTSQFIAREVQTYDSQGNELEMRREQWQVNNWVMADGFRSQRTHNASGQLTENISQFWNTFANNWENESREERTYDVNNMVATVTHAEWNNGVWELTERMVLSYNLATGNSALIQEYNGGTWQTIYRASNLVWRVPFEIPSSYLLESFNGGIWANEEKFTAVYDANGGHVGVYEVWDGSAWENEYRETETYDVNKNYTGWKEESWNGATSTWDYEGEEKEILTYAGIDVTQRIFQDSWNASGTLQDYEKEVYSNFQTFNVSGVKDLATQIAVNVYPNPTSNTLNIIFPEAKGAFSATVSDLTGKTCLTKKFKPGEVSALNIEALPKGLYLLHLETQAGSAIKRIIKQ